MTRTILKPSFWINEKAVEIYQMNGMPRLGCTGGKIAGLQPILTVPDRCSDMQRLRWQRAGDEVRDQGIVQPVPLTRPRRQLPGPAQFLEPLKLEETSLENGSGRFDLTFEQPGRPFAVIGQIQSDERRFGEESPVTAENLPPGFRDTCPDQEILISADAFHIRQQQLVERPRGGHQPVLKLPSREHPAGPFLPVDRGLTGKVMEVEPVAACPFRQSLSLDDGAAIHWEEGCSVSDRDHTLEGGQRSKPVTADATALR